ncbi:hypothetical protein RFI_23301 [Reticulomyxa filosa]|uniref:Uncharacterized protein n=1 Tax=Reticulomyxa filosa TaxID=46433 RepID=X6MLV4_RETFI|nr:hypothetical protein RFI_23301 [Reticulomyxa filosa]|eukprot:ETO14065.1 hypothetical protein RFI_23301 [Reticulomyxa filosa]
MSVIGELYNRRLLNERIIFAGLMNDLLNNRNYRPITLDIEALCTLFEQCSTNLRKKEEARKTAEMFLKRMHDIAKHMEPRIRFRVEEICAIKDNNWRNPHQADKAKKLKEIHQDFFQQQQEQSARLAQQQYISHSKGGQGHWHKKNVDTRRAIPTTMANDRSPQMRSYADCKLNYCQKKKKNERLYSKTYRISKNEHNRGAFPSDLETLPEKLHRVNAKNDETASQKQTMTRLAKREDAAELEEKKSREQGERKLEPVGSRGFASTKALAITEEDVIQSFNECLKICDKTSNLNEAVQFVKENVVHFSSHVWADSAAKVCQSWKLDRVQSLFAPLVGHAVCEGWLTYDVAMEMAKKLGTRFESERADVPMLQEIYANVFAAMVVNAKSDDFVHVFKQFVTAAQDSDTTPKHWAPLLKFGLENLFAVDQEKRFLKSFKSLGFASLVPANLLRVILHLCTVLTHVHIYHLMFCFTLSRVRLMTIGLERRVNWLFISFFYKIFLFHQRSCKKIKSNKKLFCSCQLFWKVTFS